jgi:hypothetical protein
LNEIVVPMQYPLDNPTIVKTGSTISGDHYHILIDDTYFDRSNPTVTLLCLLLYAEKRQTPQDEFDLPKLRALLLRRAPGAEIRFECVGLLRTSDENAMRDLSGINRLHFLPDELFHPEHGYTIDII